MTRELTSDEHEQLARRLQEHERYPHPVENVKLVTTHISSLLLTDTHAYKLKKPLDLGFLDFTTLEQRRHACDEELRLNRRLAPEIYLQRIPITGTPDDPRIDGEGPLLDWAVQMQRFDDSRLFDRLLESGELTIAAIEDVADQVAVFHDQAGVADADSDWGTPEAIAAPARDNIAELRRLLGTDARVERLAGWTDEQIARLRPLMEERRQQGRIRECHGDLHLGNIVEMDGRAVIFDGIEFSPALRWIDVLNEVAFLDMDLRSRGRRDLAARFLSNYLEHTGDYSGAALMPFYRAYRALVRAKVTALRLDDNSISREARDQAMAAVDRYLTVASAAMDGQRPRIFLMHGLSGSGKSTVAQALVARADAVRLRSDVERKRLHGMAATTRAGAEVGQGLYGQQVSDATYARLEELTAEVWRGGMNVVIDAATLKRAERDRIARLAGLVGTSLTLVVCHADESVLRERIRARQQAGRDASDADTSVLDHQLRVVEWPENDEADAVVRVDTQHDPDFRALDAVIDQTRR